MSMRLDERAVSVLKSDMYPLLPTNIKNFFPTTTDPYTGIGPNIVVGPIQERGTGLAQPCVAVWSEIEIEPLTNGRYIHATVYVDTWIAQPEGGNVDGRRVLAIVVEYIRRTLQDKNWTGASIIILSSYEIERSGVVFEPTLKVYHQIVTYRVDATCNQGWY